MLVRNLKYIPFSVLVCRFLYLFVALLRGFMVKTRSKLFTTNTKALCDFIKT
ncbi:MAG: hypothetical protein JRL30_18910 [Deltaproteobacteria bacterium]|nr:hypothetical protein [Deltaproteobacteria bacterium]